MKGLFDSPTHPPPEGKAAPATEGKARALGKEPDHRRKGNAQHPKAAHPAQAAPSASRRPASASCLRGAELAS